MHLLLFLLFSVIATTGYGQGLLIAKEYSWDADSKATAIEYKSVERFNTVYNVRTPDGDRKRIISGLVISEIIYSEIQCPTVLITPEDAARLSTRTTAITAAIREWPSSKKLLLPYLQANQAASSAFQRGSVLVNGKWTTRVAYEQEMQRPLKPAVEYQRPIAEAERERQRKREDKEREERQAAINLSLEKEQAKQAESARQTEVIAAADKKRQRSKAAVDEQVRLAEQAREEQENREAVEKQSDGYGNKLLVALLIIYFIPSIIAGKNGKTNLNAIIVFNLFLGWTFLGWVIALVWAVKKDDAMDKRHIDTRARERMENQKATSDYRDNAPSHTPLDLRKEAEIKELSTNSVYFAVAILAKFAKADGIVTKKEIATIEGFLLEIGLKGEDFKNAIRIFTKYKAGALSYEEGLAILAELAEDDFDFRGALCMLLLHLAHADGPPPLRSIHRVQYACSVLSIDYTDLHQAFQPQETGRSGANASDFELLGCSPNDQTDTIKKRYRELVKTFHPDKMAGKDIHPEIAKLAVAKFRDIQDAYERIMSHRNGI